MLLVKSLWRLKFIGAKMPLILISPRRRGRHRVSRYDITAEAKLSGLSLLDTARDFVNHSDLTPKSRGSVYFKNI